MKPRDQLLFLALCTMDEAIEAAGPEPIRLGVGLRLAVGYAALIGSGDRELYDRFWRVFRNSFHHLAEVDREVARRHMGRQAFNAICRRVGVEPNVSFQLELASARDPELRQRRNLAEAGRKHAADLARQDERKRKLRDCGFE